MKFDTIEEDLAKEIINIGLAKAADSLSFFTREKVLIRSVNFQLKKLEYLDPVSEKQGKNIHVLTTEIRGEMQGYCFLIFDEPEVNKLFEVSLPESIKNEPEKIKEMGEATLKEADNIITASVVTQFSNLLGVNIHGYVPLLDLLNESEVNDFIRSKCKEKDYVLNFTAKFVSDNMNIRPEFLWILDDNFVEAIQRVITNQDVLKKVAALKR